MTEKTYDSKPLDQLQLISDGKLNLIENIYGIFKTTVDQSLQLLSEASSERNFTLISKQAHSLKSSFGAVGMMRASQICRALEKSDEMNWAEIDVLLQTVKSEFAQGLLALEKDIDRRRQLL